MPQGRARLYRFDREAALARRNLAPVVNTEAFLGAFRRDFVGVHAAQRRHINGVEYGHDAAQVLAAGLSLSVPCNSEAQPSHTPQPHSHAQRVVRRRAADREKGAGGMAMVRAVLITEGRILGGRYLDAESDASERHATVLDPTGRKWSAPHRAWSRCRGADHLAVRRLVE